MPGLESGQLAEAIRAYLELAYPSGRVPPNRRQFAEFPADAPLEALLTLNGVERLAASSPGGSCSYALRIGCEWYAHMKVVIRPIDSNGPYVFLVDTHDALIVPASSSEEEKIRVLKERNLQLARSVEKQWTTLGLPTQEASLRAYLNRVKARAGE